MAKALVKRGDPMREMAVASQNQLKEAVSAFSVYVDDEGKSSTSPKGFMIAMNKTVKNAYGAAREDLELDAQAHLSGVLMAAIGRIYSGIKRRDNRASIRKDAIKMVKIGGEAYHALRRALDVYE